MGPTRNDHTADGSVDRTIGDSLTASGGTPADSGGTAAESARSTGAAGTATQLLYSAESSTSADKTTQLPNKSQSQRTKRADIQALRAVAVVSVVAYHFWPESVPAGFVGVDIFFVISGFLITGHLVRDSVARGRVDFAGFYARRAKRILPSAYIALSGAVLAVVILLPLARWESTGREGLASIFYVENIYLAKQSVDYLAEGSSLSVFQHFWSLAAEEQFYLIIPLLVAGCVWLVRRRFPSENQRTVAVSRTVIAVAAMASLGYSQWLVATGNPSGYFLLTARFWELALGSVLALTAFSFRRGWVRFGLATIGWLGLLGAVVFTSEASFPGLGALPATLATAAIIASHHEDGKVSDQRLGRWSSRMTGRLLNAAPVQHLGDISYNLYLTHWPVLIIIGGLGFGGSGIWLVAGLTLSYILAVALYQLVDTPLATVKVTPTNTKRILLLALAGSGVVALLCIAVVITAQHRTAVAQERADSLVSNDLEVMGAAQVRNGTYQTFAADSGLVVPLPQQVRHVLPSGARGQCKSKVAADTTPTCDFGNPNSRTVVALVGDSHIEQYLPAFERLAAEHDWLIRTYFKASCPFSAGERVMDLQHGGVCTTANEATMKALVADKSIDLIVTSNRTAVPWAEGDNIVTPEQGFAEYWDELVKAGHKVAVLADNPAMLPHDQTTECVARNQKDPDKCSRARDDAVVVDHQLVPAATTDVTLIDTVDWYCTKDTCPPVIGNVLVYRDEQHISVLYAQTLAPTIFDAISPLLDKHKS